MDFRSRFVIFRRVTSLVAMMALLVMAFAPAASAAQAQPKDSTRNAPSFSSQSLAKVVADSRSDDSTRSNRAASESPKEAPKQGASSGFFKTRTGALVLAVMAVGTGYAIYSANHDRIKGSAR